MRRLPILLSGVLLFAAAAASAQTIDAGRGAVPIKVPASSKGAPTPLIILLHGYTASGAIQDKLFGLSALADRYGFIAVAPDGTENQKKLKFWNAGSTCCDLDKSGVDDVAYLTTLITKIKAAYKIDDKRVFLFGHSNGGFMSHRLARDHSGMIAAIASLAGLDEERPSLTPLQPVNVLQIHGTADTAVSYGPGTFALGDKPHAGAKQTVVNWAVRNGCAVDGVKAGTLDLDSGLEGAETDVVRHTAGCQLGGAAELWTINGGGHVPKISDQFTMLVVEWLLGHPKP